MWRQKWKVTPVVIYNRIPIRRTHITDITFMIPVSNTFQSWFKINSLELGVAPVKYSLCQLQVDSQIGSPLLSVTPWPTMNQTRCQSTGEPSLGIYSSSRVTLYCNRCIVQLKNIPACIQAEWTKRGAEEWVWWRFIGKVSVIRKRWDRGRFSCSRCEI